MNHSLLNTFVLQKSVACIESANCRIKIESLHEFGLLCHPTKEMISPDAIAGVIEETPEVNSN